MVSEASASRSRSFFVATTLLLAFGLDRHAHAQSLPDSGVLGYDLFLATTAGGGTQLYAVNPLQSAQPIAFGAQVSSVPSRWSHRRRTLGATETELAYDELTVVLAPMGDAVGNGAILAVDLRPSAPGFTSLVPTGNPAGYDLALLAAQDLVFSAEDDGNGNTLLRGFSYATPGTLTPTSPASLLLPGAPAANVNRIGVDEAASILHVATTEGVYVVDVSATGTQMSLIASAAAPGRVPVTNPAPTGLGSWVIGLAEFDAMDAHVGAGMLVYDETGSIAWQDFGAVTTVPSKSWVAAAGAHELAVVSDGSTSYAYMLLREPPPNVFFIKASTIGCVKLAGSAAPDFATIDLADEAGEPFALPSVAGTRVAFETSFGPPFVFDPPGGGERIVLLYSPLDPLGAATTHGLVAVPAPLGGRISTKGMDRPLWSPSGDRIFATTSHFPGAPNPGVPGLEVLEVPPDVLVDAFSSPHTVVANTPFPDQAIVFPALYVPRIPSLATSVAGITLVSAVFHGSLAGLVAASFGELGTEIAEPGGFVQNPAIPNFRSVLAPSFDDPSGSSTTSVPANFGARRSTLNLQPGLGVRGLTSLTAIDNELHLAPHGHNVLAALGLFPKFPKLVFALPAGSMVTTEFVSL